MIPNIVKGRGITGALAYALGQGNDAATGERLVLAEGETSRAQILGGQNFGFAVESADDLDLARRMMEWNGLPQNQTSKTLKCEKDCLHASLSWEKGQEPTRAEMTEAAQSFLKSLGMTNAQAVFIVHNDTDHRHLHIIASRLDPATGKTYSQEQDFTRGQVWALRWEREHGQISQNEGRQQLHKLLDAIEARNGAAIVETLTERNPTFTGRELDKALSYGILDKKELAKFKGEILAQQNVIGLREEPEGSVYRYTTREVLAAERGLQRGAQRLADDHSHGLSDGLIAATAAAHTLKPEQAAALAHLTNSKGLAVLWGEAGTGKSHTLNATRAAYEAEGAQVIGLSWTNDVVQQMRGGGFNAETIASELKRLEHGRAQWDRNTVLIVDGAAMISTERLAALTAAAGVAGAKLILCGDDAQLSSIERGGMFETLRQTHGAAVLKDVQRVAGAERAVWGTMHTGDFREALQTFDRAGGIHWAEKQTDALRDMAAHYTADVAKSPDKRRFMFAFTNAECDALNEFARVIHQRRGDLGTDHALATATGLQDFATGDRVQFTGTGRTQQEKNNGRVGTIAEIDTSGPKPRVTVALDTAKGKELQRVSFVVGENAEAGEFDKFKRGYAGTIYRGQGRTLDQSFICHSNHFKSSAAYVALTRHRESLHIYAARETVKDLDAMARGMGRKENKRAATAYRIDVAHLARAGFGQAANVATDRQSVVYDPQLGTRVATNARARENSQGAAQPSVAPVAPKGKAAGREAFTGKGAGRTAGAVAARGARRAFGGLLDGLFRALLGESPAPQHGAGPQTAEEYTQEILQRSKAMQALSRVHGREIINQDQARMEEESAKKRDRDRGGGGQTL